MFLPRSSLLAMATLCLTSALAQVPATLSKSFNTQIQVNFKGDSAQGFNDGDTVSFSDTANQPVFALGDASGVNTAVSFIILMIDSTDPNNFIMHYLQKDFKATGDKTGLSASSAPIIPYAKPGTFGESGSRQYTFLLYLERSADIKSFPQAGGKFDYVTFNSANNLQPATAGVAMKVNIGENSADVAGAGASSSSSAPPVSSSTSTSTPPPASSTTSSSSSPPVVTPLSSSSASSSSVDAIVSDASIRTLTVTVTAPGPSETPSDGLTQKRPLQPPFGGVVSEQPFPADGVAKISNTTLTSSSVVPSNVTNSTVDSPTTFNPVAQAAVSNAVVAVSMQGGGSVAALVIVIGALMLL